MSLPLVSPVSLTEPLNPSPLPSQPRRRLRQRANSIWRKRQRYFCGIVRRKSGLVLLGASVLVFGLFLRFFSQAMSWLDPIHFYRPFAAPKPDELGDVVWNHCTGPHVERAECGYVVVPLDYTRLDGGLARIAVGRYNATSGPRKGTIFVNPGGPGSPGVRLATELGPLFHELIGPEWDIVGFDPRGTGLSEPRIRCFSKKVEYAIFTANTVLESGYEVPPDLDGVGARDRILEQVAEAEALTQTQYQACQKTMGDVLRFMGTTAVARDIEFINTALEGRHALINFYGVSYGSVIGQYLINMFPERIGRVAIDGVVDGLTWSGQPVHRWFRQELRATEQTWQIFLDECFKAGPSSCALAKSTDSTSADIARRVDDLLHALYVKPLGAARSGRPGVLTSSRLRQYIFSGLLRPRIWPDVAQGLAAALAGDASPVLARVLSGPVPNGELELEVIACSDVPPTSASDEDITDEYLHVLRNVSRFGLAHRAAAGADCAHWPYTPPERYNGPWDTKLKNPIMILSNKADPVTPLASGEEVQKLLSHSSRLLVQDGPGHVSLALASLCTARFVRTYFADGTLPPEGTVCGVDESPFDPHVSSQLTVADRNALQHLKFLGRGLHDEPEAAPASSNQRDP